MPNEERLQRMRKIVLQYRYLDDIFMSVALNDAETIGVVLSIIMGRALKVISVQAQDTVSNLYGHGVRFDVLAEDSDDVVYDIEIQRAKDGADPKRARFNIAMLDSRALERGAAYRDLPRSVVIFITENDVLGDGLPIQHFCFVSEETGKTLKTGQEIIYVDSSCQQDTPLGNMMHDFHCRDAKDIRNECLARRMEKLKNSETEVSRMCEVMETYGNECREEGREKGREEGREEGMIASIQALMENGFSIEKALELLKIPQADREKLRKQLA